MKKLTLLSLFLLIPSLIVAQQTQTLISGNIRSGGFGGPVVKMTSIGDDGHLLVGGRGGWILNFDSGNAFSIGGGGYGLTTNARLPGQFDEQGRALYLDMGYGGLELEFINRTDELVHFSIHTLIGAGGITQRLQNRSHTHYETFSNSAFFVFEPGVHAEVNMTTFFRLGFGAGYRLVSGTSLDGISDNDLSGPVAQMILKFGKF